MVIDKKNIDLDDPGCYFYYIIRMKGSFSNEWDGGTVWIASSYISTTPNSQLTSIVFTSQSSQYSAQPEKTYLYCGDGSLCLPLTGQADFQVQIIKRQNVYHQTDIGWFSMWIETVVAESDWSNTKTLTMGQYQRDEVPNQSNPASNQTLTDQTGDRSGVVLAGFSLFELSLVVALCAIIAVLAIAFMRERKTSRHKHDGPIQNMAAL